MLKNRNSREFSFIGQQEEKGQRPPLDFSKMQVGARQVDNILFNLGSYKKVDSNYGDKTYVLNAIYRNNYEQMREISKYFYKSSGIYAQLCNYLAFLYRFDYYVTPYSEDVKKEKKKLEQDFMKVLIYLDKSDVKRVCNKISLAMVTDGVFYGTVVDFNDRFGVQELPPQYCRCRYYSGTVPIVELNLAFFDSFAGNTQYRQIVLKTFPQDIQKAYALYKTGKLKGDYPGDTSCWYPLDPEYSIKISMNDKDFPPLIGVIPSIIDLDQAQELDRQKTMQQLLKILVQKLPLDKNGDLIFDMEEAKSIHDNAVNMLRRAIGVDVLTTFADIIKIDTKDNNSATTTDDLEKVERTVYNNAGISRNIFNADGNLAVTNSILADEARMQDIPLQLGTLLTRVVEKFNRKNHYSFKVEILETTQFNYKEMSKLYKEQVQLGGQKMLPEIALGQSQLQVLSTLNFENEVLKLAEIMVPPMSSNTMSNKSLQTLTGKSNNTTDKRAGRPEKSDNEKSDKTIQNRESMN